MKKIYLIILLNAFLFGCNKKEPCNNGGISKVRDIEQEILDLVPYFSKPIALFKRTTFEKDK